LTVTLSPASTSLLVGNFVQFIAVPSSTVDGETFLVNNVQGGNTTIGTINATGLYQAPAVIPANTTITITVQVSNSGNATSASATATVTLDSGVRLSIVPSSYFIGTGEQFQFAPKLVVTGVPVNAALPGICDNSGVAGLPLCTAVTWGVTGAGAINSSTGAYTASGTADSETITATSIYDTARSGTASATIVTATDPTLTSLSTNVGAVGATLQDVYLSGANFLSTTQVRANGALIGNTDLVSQQVLRLRLGPNDLRTAGPLTITGSRQGGAAQNCSASCSLTLSTVRPALVGSSLDSFPQGSTPNLLLDGGYYGTASKPAVTAQFGIQAPSAIVNSPNQLQIPLSGTDTQTPGLVPVSVTGAISGNPVAPNVANVAVQPPVPGSVSQTSSLGVGVQPSSIAINPATGRALVANQGSGSVAVIDLSGPTLLGYICTGTANATLTGSDSGCPNSGPTSVAVDNLRNLALVTNSVLKNIAVINLTTSTLREFVSTPTVTLQTGVSTAATPWAVGIDPVASSCVPGTTPPVCTSGRALVAYQGAGFATVIDLTPVPAVPLGIVAASTGATPRIAASARLHWALVTPGGAGSMAIVDLSRPSPNNAIVSISRSSNVVTAQTAQPNTLRVGDPVQIVGVADNSFNGVFTVTGVSQNQSFTYAQTAADSTSSGGQANYGLPIATLAKNLSLTGVAINDESQKAVLLDPSAQTQIFNLLDQTSTTVNTSSSTGNIAGAFNPLTNTAITVNQITNNGAIVDPTTPTLLNGDGTVIGLNRPLDVAVDPATNQALVVNSPLIPAGSHGTVSFLPLPGTLRSPQVLQVSRQDNGAGSPLPPEIMVSSTLSSAGTLNPQTLTVIGSGFSGASVVKLDGTALGTPTVSNGGRQLTVSVPAASLSGGPHIYTLQVFNGAVPSNATGFTVSQKIDLTLSNLGCTASPQSVAIDSSIRGQATSGQAIVTFPGCNSVGIINLKTGAGTTVAVGNNPQGVAIYPALALAVVANANDSTASVVDIVGNTVTTTVSTDPTPVGVAIDPGLGTAVVTASNANVVDTFTIGPSTDANGNPIIAAGAVSSLAVQARPMAVAVDPRTHLAAVANTNSGTVSLVDITQAQATIQVTATGLPAGIALDPATGSFLVITSLANQLLVLDPVNQQTTPFRAGINPTSVAYNPNSATLVTTNGVSQTLSVMDYLSGRMRAVLSFNPSGRFAVDIHPFSNLAVIADSTDNWVILRPLPR
jgi:DNA-binding beta-propeller fold protein YncE